MIVVIGGRIEKSGKTTIAVNLTVIESLKGKKVLLVDASGQNSSSDWVEHRKSLGITTMWNTIQLTAPSIVSRIKKVKDDYDIIIIDTGGRDIISQKSALTIANILIVPFQPQSLDISTIKQLSSFLNEVSSINPSLKSFVLLNRSEVLGYTNDALEIISEAENIYCLPLLISQRKEFSNAAAKGLGVVEFKPADKKAVSEITDLSDILFQS